MGNSQGSNRLAGKAPSLQISCSTPELHRRSGQTSPFLDNPATPVSTPVRSGGAPHTPPDEARKRARRGALHRSLIARYAAERPCTKSSGFPDALRRILATFTVDGEEVDSAAYADLLDSVFPLGFQPDAFRVDEDAKTLTLVEAEVTSRISPAKWLAIADLFWALDEEPWHLELHLIARTGDVFEVDLQLVAVSLCGTDTQVGAELLKLEDCPPGRSARAC